MNKLNINSKLVTKFTAASGVIMLCGSTLLSSPLASHADETGSTTTETVTNKDNSSSSTATNKPTTTIDNTNWTAVDKVKTITRTIHYVDENGNKVAPDVVESHTGEVFATNLDDPATYKAFEVVNGSVQTTTPKFASVTSPSIRGYKLKDTNYKVIPEQTWSLDGKQIKDSKTGFFTNLSTDEVINVVYTRDANVTSELKDAVPVKGYTVLSVHQIKRTINFVDETGKALADPNIQVVKYEYLAPDTMTPKEQENQENQKVAAIIETTDPATGQVNSQNVQILSSPAYKLNKVTAPTISGYHVVEKRLKEINDQYAWLSKKPHVFAVLASGLQQFITQDEVVDVVYATGDEQPEEDANKDENKTVDQTKDNEGQDQEDQTKETNKKKNKKSKKTEDQAAGVGQSNGGTGSDGSGSGYVSGGSGSGYVLPQTGNQKSSALLFGGGISMLLTAAVSAWLTFKKKFF